MFFHLCQNPSFFFHLTQKFKMAAKNGRKMTFGKKLPVESVDILEAKNFVQIAVFCSISELNVFLHFTQKFKMATKNGRKTVCGKSEHMDTMGDHKCCQNYFILHNFQEKCFILHRFRKKKVFFWGAFYTKIQDGWRQNFFVKIALFHTISEINVFLCFTQKFKMATKNGGKMIFGKNRQLTLQISWRQNFFVKIALFHTISEINVFLCFMQKFKMATKMAGK